MSRFQNSTNHLSRRSDRNRTGLSHISRFVELLLAKYELNEDDAYESDFHEPARQNSTAAHHQSQALPIVDTSMPLVETSLASSGLVASPVQNTFSFYQTD